MPYWSKKVDSNHAEIRECFRQAGWQWLDLHRLGGGVPDALVCSEHTDSLYLLEIKRLEGKRKPKASTNAKPATKAAQKNFADSWPVYVITSVEQALTFIAVPPH